MSKVYTHGASHGAIKLSLRRPLWPSNFSLPRDLAKKPDVDCVMDPLRQHIPSINELMHESRVLSLKVTQEKLRELDDALKEFAPSRHVYRDGK